MTKAIEAALGADLLGVLATLPCLLDTTPITMTLFFVVGIPLFAAGFLIYVGTVVADLRRHGVV
jgi:hypothetical protein